MTRYERPHQMAQSTGIFSAYNRIPAGAKAILADPEQMAALYAAHSMNQIAAHLHCSGDAVRRALVYHGIRLRAAGQQPGHNGRAEPKPALKTTRRMIQLAAWRAYRRLDRCPPDCPDVLQCPWDECTLDTLLEGEKP